MMTTRFQLSSVAVFTALLLAASGCANNQGRTVTGSNATDQAALGAGIGALAGFAACRAVGGKGSSCATAAVAVGAVGGFIGWRNGKQKDLAEAQAFDDAMRANHMAVVTDVAPIQRANDQGRPEAVNAWKGTTVGLPSNLLARRSPDVQRSVELAGKLASSRTDPSRVLVSVPNGDRDAVQGWLRTGFSQGAARGPRPEVQVLDASAGSVPFVRVEPANPVQFGISAGKSNQG